MTDEEKENPSPSGESFPPPPSLRDKFDWEVLRQVSRRRWFYFPRLFSRAEKIKILILGLAAAVALAVLVGRIVNRITVPVPAVGGILREGVIREPRFLNPIYATADTDRDITALVFSKLIRYDQNGEPRMDLAERVEVSPDGKSYTLGLRGGVEWHDGEKFSADDVIFTIKTIQDPEYKSPLRQNWQGVAVEKLDDATVRLTLRQPYAPFFESLALGIIPQHLWRRIPRETATLSELNLKPIGTGPYRFLRLTREESRGITSLVLTRNKNYHLAGPFLREVRFQIYDSADKLIAAYRRNEIDSFILNSNEEARELQPLDAEIKTFNLPKIFAVFFNPGAQPALARKAVRQALTLAVDREALLQKTALSGGTLVNSALPSGARSFNTEITSPSFNADEARRLLELDGWKASAGDGALERTEGKGKTKSVQKLEIRLYTSDSPELAKAAELIAEMWRAIGSKTETRILPINDLETSVIRPRAYEALLFGEVFGHEADPFAFWHTSQLKDPGLNIALYSNRAVDQLLEEARVTTSADERKKKYKEFQKIVSEEAGAIFLYSPSSFYAVRKSIKGINLANITLPEERFAGAAEWYAETRRALKR